MSVCSLYLQLGQKELKDFMLTSGVITLDLEA